MNNAIGNPRDSPAPPPMAVRRREFVAREIERAGMELFAERGYDNVSIGDIATAAGVSRRTFFRHFPSKADLIDAYATRLNLRVVAALHRRPADESAPDAICNAILDTAEMTAEEQAASLLRNQVLLTMRPDLLTGALLQVEEEMVELISVRLNLNPLTDLEPRLLVWTVLAAARAATQTWIDLGGEGPLAEHLQLAFQYVLAGWRSI